MTIPQNNGKPTALIILDGFGHNESDDHNAIAAARTPNLDRYFAQWPHTTIRTSGEAVGLPAGQMGNSEVGHITLGGGTVVRQDLVLINDAIADDSFYTNTVLLDAVERAAAKGRPLHLLGLVSDGGVHSHLDHLLALIELCVRYSVRPMLHMITDGRDTPPRSALQYLPRVMEALTHAGGAIASVSGRFFTMDRDHRWERTEKAWRMLVLAEGNQALSAEAAIRDAYAHDIPDEFIDPCVLPDAQPMDADDTIVCFNFRKDRPRQIVAALALEDFADFDRQGAPLVPLFCMMDYNSAFGLPVAFASETPAVSMNDVVAQAGMKQFHCAETEKYPHVTYYFDGGDSDTVQGEVHHLVPSPKVTTYDLQPEMSAFPVAQAVSDAIASGEYGFVLVNFANGDMVGHSGDFQATVQAVEALDKAVGQVIESALAHGFAAILTADHGNCELMVDPRSGEPHTQHTTFPVPFLVVGDDSIQLSDGGGLADVAPSLLSLLGLEKPAEMTGSSLILRAKN
ncbi:MAG: 2,3-bisphosphoglycerate-independent phosphoglycerate mutase [Gammaproteobacteria bacterium]